MPWFKVDDQLYSHPKWLAAPPGARALWVTAGSWCAAQLTDGRVPRHVLPILGGRPKDAAELVKAALWIVTEDGWDFHGWLEMQPSAEEVRDKREALSAARSASGKKGAAARWQTDGKSDGKPMANAPQDLSDAVDGKPMAPARPDPTRPSGNGCTTAAADTPAARQRRIDEACQTIAQERAQQRTDIGPGWTKATAKGIASDHHQALHAHLTKHPEATVGRLVEIIEGPPAPVFTLPPAHVDERIADLEPPPTPKIPDEAKATGLAAVAAITERLHPSPDIDPDPW